MSDAAGTAAYFGHLEKARALTRQAIASALQAQLKEAAAGYAADAGLREAMFENETQAREWAASALTLSTARNEEYLAALAQISDVSAAQKLGEGLTVRFPEDTFVHFVYMPTLHAHRHLETSQG